MTSRLPLLLSLIGCGSEHMFPETRPADACDAGAWDDEHYVLRVEHGGRQRTALVYMPPGPGPHDVVINLHEYRAEPLRQAHYSTWFPFARDNNLLLVTPDGKSATWNAGDGCCGRAAEKNIDDVGFLDKVVAALGERACTTDRVLATGIGNGAMMAHRWSCESDVPDAVVSVGGTLQTETCTSKRAIPMLHYHGTADALFPADGRKGHRPIGHTRDIWATRNGVDAWSPAVDGALECQVGTGTMPTQICMVNGMEDLWPGAAHATVDSKSPLRRATDGGWGWVVDAWNTPPRP